MKKPTICRYCAGKVIFTDTSAIYEHGKYKIYLCTNCNAYVSVHKGTNKPMGDLANAVLRMKRRETHEAFDTYWQGAGMTRSAGYKWLAVQLNIPTKKAHIGYFEMETCEWVIKLCKAANQAA